MSRLINKNIIKAMTIGISAVMTFGSLNMGAFAENVDNSSADPVDDGEKKESTASTESQLALELSEIGKQAEIVDTATDTAVDSIGTALQTEENLQRPTDTAKVDKTTIPGTNPAADALSEELTDGDVTLASQKADSTDENKEQAQSEEKEQGEAEEDEVKPADLSVVVDEITDAAASLDDLHTAIISDVNYKNANEAATAGNKAASDAEGYAADANKLILFINVEDEEENKETEQADNSDIKDQADNADDQNDQTDNSDGQNDDADDQTDKTDDQDGNADDQADKTGSQDGNADDQTDKTDNQDGNADDQTDKTDNRTDDTDGQDNDGTDSETGESDAKTQDLVEFVEGKAQIVEDADKDIKDADSIEEADAAIGTARQAAKDADDSVNDAAKLVDKFDKACKDYTENKEKYDTAVANLNEKLAAYNILIGADGTISADADEALAEIERLKAETKKLEDAAKASEANFKAAGYGLIAAREAEINTAIDKGNKPDWTKYRNLASAIMQYHVLEEGKTFKSLKWQTSWSEYGDTYTFEDGTTSPIGDVLNYGILTYYEKDENGKKVEKTMKINYKTVDGNNRAEHGIVIFEKTEYTVVDGKDMPQEVIDVLNGDDKTAAVQFNGKYYAKNEEGKYVSFDTTEEGTVVDTEFSTVEDVDAIALSEEDDPVVNEVVDKDTVETTYSYEDGKLVKTVTAEVTTTTYTGSTLKGSGSVVESGNVYDSVASAEKEFKIALQDKVDNLEDGQVLKFEYKDANGETKTVEYSKGDAVDSRGFESTVKESEVTGYKVKGNYTKLFSTTVYLEDDGFGSYAAADTAANTAVSNYDPSKDERVNYVSNSGWFGLGIIGGDYYGKHAISAQYNNDAKVDPYTDEAFWFWEKDVTKYKYTASYTVQYEEVDSYKVPFSELFSSSEAKKKKINEEINKITENGGIYYDCPDGDGNIGTMTIEYIPGEKTNEVELTETDESKLDEALKDYLSQQGIDANRVVVTSKNEIKSQAKYGYAALQYLLSKDVTSSNTSEAERKVISTTTWDNAAEATTRTEYRNDNWYNGNIIIAEYINENGFDYTTDRDNTVSLNTDQEAETKELRDRIADALTIAGEYATLAEKAGQAQSDLEEASNQIKILQEQIQKLSKEDVNKLNSLTAQLKDAKAKLSTAIEERDNLLERMKEVEEDYTNKVADLSKVDDNTDDVNGGSSDDNTDDVNGGSDDDNTDDVNGGSDDDNTDDVNGGSSDDTTDDVNGGSSDDNTDDVNGGSSDDTTDDVNGGSSDDTTDDVNGGSSDDTTDDVNGGSTDNTADDVNGGSTDNTTDDANGGNGGNGNAADDANADNANADDANADDANADGGNAGGNADGGDADGGNADGGNADGGNADGGNADGGNADGGNADDGNAGGNVDGGNANGGNAGGNANGGNAGGNADGGNAGGNANGGNAGGNADGGNADANGNGNETETIENEDSALAEGIGDADGNGNGNAGGEKIENIGNEDSALAEGIDTVQTHRKWNWWWLLIVAALTGGTTYGIIKGTRRNKENAEKNSDNK